MALSVKARNCVQSVIRLSDEEVAEILHHAERHQGLDPSLTTDAATHRAVTELIEGMRQQQAATPHLRHRDPGVVSDPETQRDLASLRRRPADTAAPARDPAAPPPDALGGMAAALTGAPTTKGITDRITHEGRAGFKAKVDAAVKAGDITRSHGDLLMEKHAGGSRDQAKAKDDLMQMRERAAERRVVEKEAGKSWDDPDFNHEDGHPAFKDLSPEHRRQWTEAVEKKKASGDLYERILAEHEAVAKLPKADTEGDVAPLRDAHGRAHNPDHLGEQPLIPKEHADKLTDGIGAASWLAKNSKDKNIRTIAAKVAEVLDKGITIQHNVDKDTPGLSQKVAAAFADTAEGVALVKPDGTSAIYFGKRPLDEVTLLHELIHSATQRGLAVNLDPALRKELVTLQTTIERSLRALERDGDMTAEGKDAAQFFRSVVNNPDELLAYGLTSPNLRRFLENFNEDGTTRTLGDQAGVEMIQRIADRNESRGEPAPRTLWQRFVDFVRSTIGLPEKYSAEIQRIIEANANEKQVFLTEHMPKTAIDRLNKLFDRALEQQKQTEPGDIRKARQAGTAARIDGQSSRPVPNVLPKGREIPDFEPQNGFAKFLKDNTPSYRNKPWMLGWMTLRQLGDRFKDVPGVKQFQDLSASMGAKSKQLMAESHSVDQAWATMPKEHATEMQKLMLESTLNQMWPNKAWESHGHLDLTSPSLKAKQAAMRKRWDALPEVARRTYENAQAKMRKDWDERGRLLDKRITDQYRTELHRSFPGEKLDNIAAIPKADREAALKGLTRSEQKSLTSLWSDRDEHANTLSQMQGPYFPLMRFGDHVVVAKSNDLNAATDRFTDAQQRLDALNSDDEASLTALKKAREEVKAAQEEVLGLKDDEKHYLVEFYESRSDAFARQKQLVDHFAGRGEPMAVYAERREEHFGKVDQVPPTFMKKLEESLSANLPDKDANAVRMAVRDLYIQSMPERSALKSELRRIGVAGVKESEMRRAFAASTMRSAWHLSRLEFGPEMQQHLADLRTGEGEDQRIVGSELTKRMAATMQQSTNSLMMDRLSNLSYLTYLGMSPSFFIINSMQPWTISLPVMAARHGLKTSTAELGRAFADTGAAMKLSLQDQKTWRFELNLENFKDPAERAMLSNLFNKGIIDVTIEHDIGSLAGGRETGAFGKAMEMATLPAHHTEVMNRVMTALAAYRMEAAAGKGDKMAVDKATRYAEQIVADTHLDYSPENSPRFMRSASLGGLGRIIFQFKKYTQGMTYLFGKMTADAYKGDKEAQKGLMYLMGMTLAASGASGLPMATGVGILAKLVSQFYPDDDQPEFYQTLYEGAKSMLGETGARAIFKGLPAAAGADISGRVGFGNLLNPIAFANSSKQGADYIASVALALAGPAASMTANYAEALVMAKDDPMKAVERAIPKFLADPLRAIDRANRGITDKRGNVLISPDEFGPMAIGMRAAGFEHTDVSDMYERRGAFVEAKKARDDARSRLIRQAAAARKDGGDTEGAQEKIDAFNERNPDDRIKGSNITSQMKAGLVTARTLKDGVNIRKNDRALAERLGIGQ